MLKFNDINDMKQKYIDYSNDWFKKNQKKV